MLKKNVVITLFILIILSMGVCNVTYAQNSTRNSQKVERKPNPKIAFLKSLIIPGWGHYYVNKHHWTRGKYQLAASAILIASYLGLRSYSSHLRHNMFTYAETYSGTKISNRSVAFQLNVADFNSTSQYNSFQERARNWGQLYPETQKYYWKWQSEQDRLHYLHMKNRYDRTHQQLPTLLTLMVANRLISGISAYIRAKKMDARLPDLSFSMPVDNQYGGHGIMANLRFSL